MPVAEAARSRLRHLRKRHRNLQLREPPFVLRGRRAVRRIRHDGEDPASPRHRSPARWTHCWPIDHHARAYARKVASASKHKHGDDDGDDRDDKGPAYRLYEVQNGNHIETFQVAFPAARADRAARAARLRPARKQVERDVPLPPDQCVPRGKSIADSPVQAGRCASLFVP